ncbi:MAG: NYN domain-containing protein [Bacteroidia bacterium]
MIKIGIYVDAANILMNGGFNMRYDQLRAYCTADKGIPIRLNTYLAYDEEKAKKNKEYRERQQGYHTALRNFGYKVVIKKVKWFKDEEGNRVSKANADLDMAVDMLLQSKNLDKMYLLTGDGDFRNVVRAVQNEGVRVEVIAFRNISHELIHETDLFSSGYLIPNLRPVDDQGFTEWAKPGKRARGVITSLHDGYGFIRFMDMDYEWQFAYFAFKDLPKKFQAKTEQMFTFEIAQNNKGYQAQNMVLLEP